MSDIAQKPRGLRALYAWMLTKAQGRNAWMAVAAFAFAEQSRFPEATQLYTDVFAEN